MSAYWIAIYKDLNNFKDLKKYAEKATPAIKKFKGKILVRGGKAETIEGNPSPRTVIIKFSNMQEALNCYNSDEYQEAFTEFKKYVGLIGMHGQQLAMMSEPVDNVWHQFILFTQQYHDFCDDFLGGYLHHVPKTSHTPLDKQNKRTLTSLYKQTFGDPSSLWDIKADCSSCNNGCSSSGMCSGGGDD